ncbi:MAG: flavin reductase family protein [Thermomicrobiales bacterium]
MLQKTDTRQQFVDAMSRVASSVWIVTTDGPGGRFGLTVSAVTSVTADPPTVLVCVNCKTPVETAIRENFRFVISALRADQRSIAMTFAGRPKGGTPYDFTASNWSRSPGGIPLLSGAVAWLECQLLAVHHVGTHAIFIGRVEHAGSSAGMPLVYGRRSFAEIMHLPESAAHLATIPDPIWDEPLIDEGEQ